MKRILLFIPVLAGLLLSCTRENAPVLEITGGLVQGVLTDSSDVMVYKGIPYAAPPVGDLRWKAPQSVITWDGVLLADHFSLICPQQGNPAGTFYGNEFYWQGTPNLSEDCLYLNVWTPAKVVGDTSAKLPVAMWIHGGAMINGYGHEITMDGDAWAQRGVILVTINYRLGYFGFLCHPLLTEEGGGVSGNYGLLDQIAALGWIKDNIAQFGGDPDNVTVFGQSAGAQSVKNLVTSPLSKDLIAKAIIQSGGGLGERPFPDPAQDVYDAQGKDLCDAIGLSTLEEMRAAGYEDFLRASALLQEQHKSVRLGTHAEGKVMEKTFEQAVYDNEIADIPYMIGCVERDSNGHGDIAITHFASVRDSLSSKPVYTYFFNRNLPGDDDDPATDAGAYHSSELWYMFHTLKNSWRPFTEADYALSGKMMDFWTNFVKYGDPKGGWTASTKDAPFTMILDIDKP